MTHPVFTRQMWCERCEKEHRPHKENRFIVIGENGLHLRTVERYVDPKEYGFTPHFVSVYKLLDEKTVAITRVCSIIGCGVEIEETAKRYKLKYKHVSYEQLPLSDWNALVAQKDFGYYI